jgi:hypothetical protein
MDSYVTHIHHRIPSICLDRPTGVQAAIAVDLSQLMLLAKKKLTSSKYMLIAGRHAIDVMNPRLGTRTR